MPPVTPRPWWQELNFFMDPFQVQDGILRGRDLATGTFLMQQQVVVGGLEVARDTLLREGDTLEGSVPPHLERILGSESIGIARGAQHDRLRALLAPAFTADEVEGYLPELQALCESYCDSWLARGTVEGWEGQLKRLTFEVICRLVCGFRLEDGDLDALSALFADLSAGVTSPLQLDLPFTPWGRAMAARRRITAAISRQAQALREERAGAAALTGGAPQRRSVLSRLLEAEAGPEEEAGPGAAAAAGARAIGAAGRGGGLSESELLDNFVGILIAGHDTTASSLSMLLCTLAQHPDVLDRLRSEQADVVARHGAAVTAAAVRDMPYADAVVREAWRLHPVVPLVGRVAVEDVELGGYLVPKGQPLAVALNYLIKTDARWAGLEGPLSPLRFNPDRFLQPTAGPVGGQLVFGAGKRYCLGAALATAEVKVLLAVLLRAASFQLVGPVRLEAFPFPTAHMTARFTSASGAAARA